MTPILESKRYYAAICIAALSLAMAPRASADEIYAFAGNVLTNFQIQSAPGTVIAVTGTRNTFNSAQYGITSDSTQAPEVIPAGSDASQAAVGSGPFPGEDVFTVFEGQGSLNGARADSQTLSGNPFTGDGGSSSPFVANVAEAEIPGGVGSPAATSSAANTANATFTVTVPTTITFAFTDAIALQADTGALGDSANASIANSFEIATLQRDAGFPLHSDHVRHRQPAGFSGFIGRCPAAEYARHQLHRERHLDSARPRSVRGKPPNHQPGDRRVGRRRNSRTGIAASVWRRPRRPLSLPSPKSDLKRSFPGWEDPLSSGSSSWRGAGLLLFANTRNTESTSSSMCYAIKDLLCNQARVTRAGEVPRQRHRSKPPPAATNCPAQASLSVPLSLWFHLFQN